MPREPAPELLDVVVLDNDAKSSQEDPLQELSLEEEAALKEIEKAYSKVTMCDLKNNPRACQLNDMIIHGLQ